MHCAFIRKSIKDNLIFYFICWYRKWKWKKLPVKWNLHMRNWELQRSCTPLLSNAIKVKWNECKIKSRIKFNCLNKCKFCMAKDWEEGGVWHFLMQKLRLTKCVQYYYDLTTKGLIVTFGLSCLNNLERILITEGS